MKRGYLLTLSALLFSVATLEAKVSLSSIWADDMVLQRNQEVLFWGESTAANGKSVTIEPSWSTKRYRAVVQDGAWSVKIPTVEAGGPYNIRFNDGEELCLEGVLLGDVWLCLGQSNMQMALGAATQLNQPVFGAQRAIVEAQESDRIRMYKMEVTPQREPQSDVEGHWARCSSKSVAEFSAVGYLFGRELYEKLDVPIGLLSINKGASKIETWMSEEWLESVKRYDYSALKGRKIPDTYHREVCFLYNGMLAPLEGLAVKGAIWYQGESNIDNYEEYLRLFPSFVNGLRSHFDGGEFPFYYVQIAPYAVDPKGYNGVLMREAQGKLMDLTPRTGMVVLTDVGEEHSIHPRHKREVAERLALWAFSDAYGIEGLDPRSAEYRDMRVMAINPGAEQLGVGLRFSTPKSLHFADGVESTQFEIAGEDQIFHPARAKFVKFDSEYTLVVWSEAVAEPVAVRYAFHNYAKGDLFNNFGLPVSSFRTDSWALPVR